VHIETEDDASVGTLDSSVGEATHDCELQSLPVSCVSSNSGIPARSSRSPGTVSKSSAARQMCATCHSIQMHL
jgi:hypothetical protein